MNKFELSHLISNSNFPYLGVVIHNANFKDFKDSIADSPHPERYLEIITP